MKQLHKTMADYFGVPKARPNPAQMKHLANQSAAARKVKALLNLYPSIAVERDRGDFWVLCSDFEEGSDPLDDSHFATSWQEVLELVEVYVEAITKATAA